MDHVDILLKLKDLLRDTCGKQAISRLVQLPLIIDYLNDSKNFQMAFDRLGQDCHNWNPLNICKIASDIDESASSKKDSLSQVNSEIESQNRSINLQSIGKLSSLIEIYPFVDKINTLSILLPWSQIFEQMGLENYIVSDPKKKLETIFGILFEISEDKNNIFDCLIEFRAGNAGIKMLSRLMMTNKSISDYVINSLDTKSFKPSLDDFVSLLKEAHFLGEQDILNKLVESYLEVYPFDENFQNRITHGEIENDLSKLQYLKNYSALYRIAGKNEALEKLSNIVQGVLSTLGQGLGLITHFERDESQTHSAIDPNNPVKGINREISKIKEISQTDLESANTLALEFAKKVIAEPETSRLIYDWNYGFLIEPEILAQFLIDFRLFSQAQDILNKMLALWPQNSLLLRIAANLAHDKGDHHNAAGKFALLGLYDELTREEKIKFASSLEYLKAWLNAFEIRKFINITTAKDFRDTFNCAFHAEKTNVLSNLISDNGKLIQSSKIALLLQKIAEEDKEQIILIVKNLEVSDYSNDKNHFYFILVSDYLRRSGKLEIATAILENCIRDSKLGFPIVNRLYSIYQEIGDREKSHSILNSIKNKPFESQEDFETFINFLIQSGENNRANQYLLNAKNSWELSPRKINLYAKILIEKGKFSEAEKILLPLLFNENNDIDNNLNYCLAVLKCRIENFPFGIEIGNPNKLDEIRKIFKPNESVKSLLLELLDTELSTSNRFEKYQQILNKYTSSSDPDVWRIYAGLGKIYFDLDQFDSAIINFKRANQIQPDNQNLYWLLVKSYANLRLWNEIESLLDQRMVHNSQSILSNFNEFGILTENSEWPRFLENQIQKKPDEIVYKVLLAQYFSATGKKTDAVEIIKGFYEILQVESDFYLLCVQILLDAHEAQLAERLIEVFLVNKKSPDKSDYLACAFLFEQLGRSEKALTMMNHIDNLDFALVTFKSKLLNDLGKTNQSQNLIMDIVENDDHIVNTLVDIKVRIPELVKQSQENQSQAYLMASSFAIKNKDTDKAISILELGLTKNPENPDIQFNLLDLLNITRKSEKIERLLEKLNGPASEICLPSLLCLLGEIALSRGEEVKSAHYLSEAMILASEDPRIKALQARIVAINGNAQEAKLILNEVIQALDKASFENIGLTAETYYVNSMLWLAEAAGELKDIKTTFDVCKQEIQRFGYHPPLINLFLSAFAAELEKIFVLRELKSSENFALDRKELLDIFANIHKNNSVSHSNSDIKDELIIKCQLFLENDQKVVSAAEKFLPNPENINSIIYAIFQSKGSDAAEIVFNSFNTHENNEFFLAVLEKDLNPEKSLGHLQKSISSNAPEAIHNALLAIIEKNLGNISDAYSAISLALEQSPNEYEWEIMAGDLCKLKGDLHASISHYQKAQTLNLTQGIDKNINDLYLSLGTTEAIPILEKQLLETPNLDQTIQLGKIYLKAGNYRKAVNVFETAIKEYPQNADASYWLCEIALNLNNPSKALDNIDDAIAKDGLNNLYISKKAEIINKIDGFPQAVAFIDDELSKREIKDVELLKYKVRLISEHDGETEALKVLNLSHNILEIPELMLEKAVLEMRLGRIGESELIAEKLLDNQEIKAKALALLGSISQAKGEFDRAIDFYIKSIEADPFAEDKFIQLAEIYHDRKEFKNAIKTLDDGMRSNPGSFNLLYRSGLYFYQQGGYNEAGRCIREAIKMKPDHREAKELLGLLESVITINNYSLADQIAE